MFLRNRFKTCICRKFGIDDCDRYAICGAYGSCNINNSPPCGCLKGYAPKSPLDWEMADWSHGCVRKTPLECRDGQGFLKYSGIKLPDTQHSWYNRTMNLKECQQVCLKNCNCTAYANLDIRGEGSGCILWLGKLIDTREFSDAGQDIYIRMAASELVTYRRLKGKTKVKVIVVSLLAVGITLLGLCLILHLYKRKKKKEKKQIKRKLGNMLHTPEQDSNKECQDEHLELPLFGFSTIAVATNNFSVANKLGKGGFGPVYKGKLMEGQEIGVKRLSRLNPKISDFGIARSFGGDESEANTKRVVIHML